MLTLIPWLLIGLTGIVVTATLMAAQWYISESRYRIGAQLTTATARALTADHKDVIAVPSASGRDVVVTLAAPLPVRQVKPEAICPWA